MNEASGSSRVYYAVFAGLIVLTCVTVGLSFVELGRWHAPVGVAIALVKASLVALFFMHLIVSSRLCVIMFLGGLFWLGILIVLTLSDYLTRDHSF